MPTSLRTMAVLTLGLAGVLAGGLPTSALGVEAPTDPTLEPVDPAAPGVDPVAAPVADPLTDDVIAWFRSADPTLVVDTACADPAGRAPLVFTANRIIARTRSVATTTSLINSILGSLVGPPPGGTWVRETQTLTLPVPPSGPTIVPVVRFDLKPRSGAEPHPLVRLARLLNDRGTRASLDYGLTPSPFVKFWPDGPPTPAPALDPQRTLTIAGGQPVGAGVRIDIYDTGMIATNQAARLTDVARLAFADQENADVDGNRWVNYPHAAHGLAMAGVIETLSPGASIRIGRIANRSGLATDWSAALRAITRLKQTPKAQWPDLVVHAFGSAVCDRQAGQPASSTAGLVPLALEAFVEALARFSAAKPDGLLLVASSGNRASTQPFYPAAFQLDPKLAPVVVSVGAIDATQADGDASAWFTTSRTGPVSDYSNTGSWVEAFAPGDHLATTHANGLRWDPDPAFLRGIAYVEGTSFAAPYAAALIAEVMSRTGQRGDAAWADIVACGAAPRRPRSGSTRPIGPGVAVGLRSISSLATDPPAGRATC